MLSLLNSFTSDQRGVTQCAGKKAWGHRASYVPRYYFKKLNQKNRVNDMKINKKLLGTSVALLGIMLLPNVAFAIGDGTMFNEQIVSLEALIMGGYARIALLLICIIVAVVGAIKQAPMVFVSGIGAAVFVYMMRNWIQETFSVVA